MKSKNQNRFTKGTFLTVILFYILVAFEFFYMASPFAAYFYSLYKPGLSFIDKYPSISWITGFFLPHLVESTKSPLLNSIKSAGVIIASLGFLFFLVCACQVYYAKIFKKGMVNGGLYKYIRHPQYSAFAICSFGLLLLWPRFLVLIMFITLLFAYYLLAEAEERECIAKYGESYIKYMKRTFMFLPIKTPFHLSEHVSAIPKALIIAGVYLILISVTLTISTNIKRISVNSLHSQIYNDKIYVSIYELSDDQMQHIIKISDSDSLIYQLTKKKTGKGAKFVNYIVPTDMYISEIPMLKNDGVSCHVYDNDFETTRYKVVYCSAVIKDDKPITDGREILTKVIALEPLAEARIDMKTQAVIQSFPLPSTTLRYKNIPEPVF